jgi:hypothetical protein
MKEEKKQITTRAVTALENRAINDMKTHQRLYRDIFRVAGKGENGKIEVEPVYLKGLSEDDALAEFQSKVYAATGATSQQVGLGILTKACEAITIKSESLEESVRHLNTIANAMHALRPRDEIEGQLISQLVVLHEQCMSWLGRAIRTERVDFANTYLNGASKLLARHHETLEALLKYRRGGEQRVHVEHVHVNDGGKAVVGHIEFGGGVHKKTEEGPHAKV